MKIKTTILLAMLAAGLYSQQMQNMEAYQKLTFGDGPEQMGYRLLLPLDFDDAQKYPLLLFLNGGGQRGSDNEKHNVK